jgi:2-polyprenyl-3-methyl-5-hydroxy-6-metoxy-1,4-benzoquinol methylase
VIIELFNKNNFFKHTNKNISSFKCKRCNEYFTTKVEFGNHKKKHNPKKRKIWRFFYEFLYKYSKAPWDSGPRSELIEFIKNQDFNPSKVIDIGCGTGSNAIFLAQHGYEVTGVDFATSAILKAKEKAKYAGVNVNFVEDDITNLQNIKGFFDLLVDYGTFDDLSHTNRQKYIETVLSLTKPGTQFFLWTFEWKLYWWERFLLYLMPFANMALEPGEIYKYFGKYFNIKRICGSSQLTGWPRGYACYLMTRKTADK